MNAPPRTGARFRGPHQICALALLAASSAFACDYPAEGTVALDRALTKVKVLPETEAWQAQKRKAGIPVQFRLRLDKDAWFNRRCYWTVEAVAKEQVWRRFYVSPDGKSVLIDYETALPAGEAPPKPTRPAAPKAAKP